MPNTPRWAFIIAFTSDFIPRLVYIYRESLNGTLDGFVNASLSRFDIKDFKLNTSPEDFHGFENVTECYYKDFRYPPDDPNKYTVTIVWWHVMAARIAFVVLFENVVILTTSCIRFLIPDMPGDLKKRVQRETYTYNEMLLRAELDKLKHLSESQALMLSTRRKDTQQSSKYNNNRHSKRQLHAPTSKHTGIRHLMTGPTTPHTLRPSTI